MQHVLLIVGDAPSWSGEVDRALRTRLPGVRVSCLHDPIEALRRVEEQPVDLAIADLILPRPGFGGASILSRIRELCPRCRTVLATDHDALATWLRDAADLVVAEQPLDGWRLAGQALDLVDRLAESRTMPRFEPDQRSDSRRPIDQLFGGKYRPIERLGRGGMGEVFRAEDTFIHRPVALKLMRVPRAADLEEMRQRMRREVTIAGRLGHPHVVTVHDAGVDEDVLYFVMELVEGQNLAELLRERGALPASEAVAMTLQVLDALDHAHTSGFVHRDLKPANVLVGHDHVVKVADFGLAKLFDPAPEADPPSPLHADLTRDEQVLGTPQYMAPEQFRSNEEVGPASDLYAAGLLLYEMLHGQALAQRIKPLTRAIALTQPDRDPPLPVYRADLRLHAVLERALALFPETRFSSARAFADALTATRAETWQRYLRWPFRRGAE